MNNRNNKWLGRMLMLSAVTLGMIACSDDHFDINPEVNARGTLWKNISSNSELSEFADILQNVYYSKSEGNTTVQTYADLFNHEQTYTIWAPKNGTFNYQYYKQLLDENTVDSKYKVEKELIRNNMTRFAHLANGSDSIQLDLFNNKTAWFNYDNLTMGGKKIVEPNIGATNGVLHIMDGAVEYLPNIYEFLDTRPEIDSLRQFIKGYEEIEFNEDASTQGPTVNGYITWVDSSTYVSNNYFYQLGAYLNREDSCYAMIMPTNEAWAKMLAKSSKYYNYMTRYDQKIEVVDNDGNINSETYTTTFTDEELDSIVNLRTKNAICGDLVFNANLQWQHPYTDFNVPGACDSLISTGNTIFHDPHSAELFDGAEPIELSNGYAYIVNNLNYKPSDTWAFDKIIEADLRNAETYSKCTISSTSINEEVEILDEETDSVILDSVMRFTVAKTIQTSASSNPEVTFKMPNTLSCKYDIYVLMAYNTDAKKPNQFNVSIKYHDGTKATTKSEKLKVPDEIHGSGNNFQNLPPHFDENGKYQYVDSVLVAKDFKFPVCYYNVRNAYPTLTITSYVSSKQTATFSREMWIDKIVLIAKEDDSEE